MGDSVSSGGVDPLEGQLFDVEFLDGEKERIFVLEESGRLLWEDSVFLPAGQITTKDPGELFLLGTRAPRKEVPSSLVEKMKEALAEHNKAVRAAAVEKDNRKPAP